MKTIVGSVAYERAEQIINLERNPNFSMQHTIELGTFEEKLKDEMEGFKIKFNELNSRI